MPFGRPFRAISLCVSFPGLKPWAVFCSPVGRLELAQENVQTPEARSACMCLASCPNLLVVVLRPRPFFGWYERNSRRLLSPFILHPS